MPRTFWFNHFFEGLLPRPLPDGFPVLLGPFFGPLDFLAMLSPPFSNHKYFHLWQLILFLLLFLIY